MDTIERLTLEAAAADTVIACEHRQRYEFAADWCKGLRVLDLCCGSGYGSAILAEKAASVVGVDYDAASVDMAAATVGAAHENVSFATADAGAFVRGSLAEDFDIVVCFEGLEHLPDVAGVLEHLRAHCDTGLRLIASVPNSKLFEEENDFHLTDFGYEEMLEAFAGFTEKVVCPQFLSEGSLILPGPADRIDVTVTLDRADEIEYANHFIVCVNLPAEPGLAHHGRGQLSTAPVHNRYMRSLEAAVGELMRTNSRLGHGHLGKAASGAAAHLQHHYAREEQLRGEAAQWQARALAAETALTALHTTRLPERALLRLGRRAVRRLRRS